MRPRRGPRVFCPRRGARQRRGYAVAGFEPVYTPSSPYNANGLDSPLSDCSGRSRMTTHHPSTRLHRTPSSFRGVNGGYLRCGRRLSRGTPRYSRGPALDAAGLEPASGTACAMGAVCRRLPYAPAPPAGVALPAGVSHQVSFKKHLRLDMPHPFGYALLLTSPTLTAQRATCGREWHPAGIGS